MATVPQAQSPSGEPDALGPELAAYFERMGAEQAVWTPAALDALARAVDSAPAINDRETGAA